MPGPSDTDCDVVVIGGGIAGCVASRDAQEAGHSVILLEAKDHLGGRTWFKELGIGDRSVEFGGTWIHEDYYVNIMRDAKRYDLPIVKTEDADVVALVDVDNGKVDLGFSVPPEQWQDFERGMFEILSAAKRIDPERPLSDQGLEDLDVSWREFLAGLDLPRETHNFIDGWTILNFGADTDEVSALWIFSFIAACDNSAYALCLVHSKIGNGSMDYCEHLTQDVDVRLDSPVASVTQGDDSISVTTADGTTVTARAAILAAPVNTWGEISFEPKLSDVKQELSAKGHPGYGFKVWALVEKPEEGNLCILNPGADVIQYALTDYHEPDGDLIACFGKKREGFDLGDPQVIEDSLAQARPGIKVLKTEHHDWCADPYAQGTWAVHPPGWLSGHQAEMRRREGRLAFAGADVAIRLTGLIEGAAGSGVAAAADVVEFLADN
jgi:monoamine oxidase